MFAPSGLPVSQFPFGQPAAPRPPAVTQSSYTSFQSAPQIQQSTLYKPTQPMVKPTRQAVNDPGMFGQQAAGVNARLAQLLNPNYANVNQTDSDIFGSIQAHDQQMQSGARMAQAAAAERADAEGTLGTGGMQNVTQQIMEQAREQQGAYAANLVNEKSRERQGQIQQALQLGSGLLDSQQQRNLQRELADLQNEQEFNKLSLQSDLGFGDLNTRNRGMDLQNGQYYAGLGENSRQFDQSQGQQNSQFYDRLGFDQSAFESTMNANVIQQLLGF